MLKNQFISIVFLFLILVSQANSQSFRQTPQAQIFLLQNANNKISCTATIYKPSRFRCALVTNAHCVGDGKHELTLVESFHQLPSIDLHRSEIQSSSTMKPSYKVSVLKSSKAMDLAELSIPDDIADFYCGSQGLEKAISHSIHDIANSSVGIISTGFVNENPHYSIAGTSTTAITSTGIVTWPMTGNSEREIYKTEILEMPEVFMVRDLKVYKGMSGGAIIDRYKNFLGINIWVRNHGISQSFFIPTLVINKFIFESPKVIEVIDDPIKIKLIPSGGNGHANGGSDGQRLETLESVDRIEDFLFSAEGFISVDDPYKMILGINGQSVDGKDDLMRLTKQFPDSKQISKPADLGSYPDIDIRKQFWERLAGHFNSKTSHALARSYARSSIYVFDQNRKKFQKELNKTATPEITVQIDPNLQQIFIKIEDHFFRDSLNPRFFHQVSDVVFKFSLNQNNDSKTLTLSPVDSLLFKEPLNCNNDQFLKINCSSGEIAMSLHLAKPNQLDIMYVMKLDGERKLLNQIFAELQRAKER